MHRRAVILPPRPRDRNGYGPAGDGRIAGRHASLLESEPDACTATSKWVSPGALEGAKMSVPSLLEEPGRVERT